MTQALERPDLIWNSPRTINMSTIGDALLDTKDPPIRALYVYNSNPVAVAPDSAKVVRGFAREDLFCVVHDVFLTDTADYADIVLPATTQLEHVDVHSSYGHLYVLANNRAIEPLGEAKPNTEVFRLLAARDGIDRRLLPGKRRGDGARNALLSSHSRADGHRLEHAQGAAAGSGLNVPSPFAPFAQGRLSDAVGQVRVLFGIAGRQGLDPLPTYTPPRESVASNPDAGASLPARHAVAAGAQRSQLDLRQPAGVSRDREDAVARHPSRRCDARAASSMATRCASSTIVAPRADGACHRQGTRRAWSSRLSIWWRKLSPDGTNANMVTGQALTDMGRAATFYDALVEVEKA